VIKHSRLSIEWTAAARADGAAAIALRFRRTAYSVHVQGLHALVLLRLHCQVVWLGTWLLVWTLNHDGAKFNPITPELFFFYKCTYCSQRNSRRMCGGLVSCSALFIHKHMYRYKHNTLWLLEVWLPIRRIIKMYIWCPWKPIIISEHNLSAINTCSLLYLYI